MMTASRAGTRPTSGWARPTSWCANAASCRGTLVPGAGLYVGAAGAPAPEGTGRNRHTATARSITAPLADRKRPAPKRSGWRRTVSVIAPGTSPRAPYVSTTVPAAPSRKAYSASWIGQRTPAVPAAREHLAPAQDPRCGRAARASSEMTALPAPSGLSITDGAGEGMQQQVERRENPDHACPHGKPGARTAARATRAAAFQRRNLPALRGQSAAVSTPAATNPHAGSARTMRGSRSGTRKDTECQQSAAPPPPCRDGPCRHGRTPGRPPRAAAGRPQPPPQELGADIRAGRRVATVGPAAEVSPSGRVTPYLARRRARQGRPPGAGRASRAPDR